MKHSISILLFSILFLPLWSLAQDSTDIASLRRQADAMQSDLNAAGRQIKSLQLSTAELERKDSAQAQTIDSLSRQLARNEAALIATTLRQDSAKAQSIERYRELQHSRTATLWALIAVLALLAAAVAALFFLMNKRQRHLRAHAESLAHENSALKTETEKLQSDWADSAHRLLEMEHTLYTLSLKLKPAPPKAPPASIDHSLPLKIAGEVVRAEITLSRMDPSVRGYRHLQGSLRRLRQTLQDKGYEIVDMMGKPYDIGMVVTANFIPDDTLPPGAQIITGVSRPQVNYNGRMIQSAQIMVSQN